MAPGTRKQVQEMNIDGFLLVQRKKKKVIQSHKSEIKTENSAAKPGPKSKKRKVEQDQTEVTIFVHFRSISRASSITRQSLEERSMTITETRTEGQEPIKGRKISNRFFLSSVLPKIKTFISYFCLASIISNRKTNETLFHRPILAEIMTILAQPKN